MAVWPDPGRGAGAGHSPRSGRHQKSRQNPRGRAAGRLSRARPVVRGELRRLGVGDRPRTAMGSLSTSCPYLAPKIS
eukprot:scaffold39129_cov27-Phaeocystis_antarctica.AAC.1